MIIQRFSECYEWDTDYSGFDVSAVGDVPSIRACQVLCEASSECNVFTYAPGDNNGWFKSSDSGRSNFGDKHSGPKICP